MAITPIKSNNKLTALQLQNPAFGNVSAANMNIPLPSEGELFLMGGTGEQRGTMDIGLRSGDVITRLGVAPGAGGRPDIGGLTGQLGADINALKIYNPSDIAPAGGPIRLTESPDFNVFKQGYQAGVQTPSSAVTGQAPTLAAGTQPPGQFGMTAAEALNVAGAKAVTPTTPDKSLYIGPTNWAKLQQQYSPEQLAYATMKVGNDIYWNPERHIEDYGKTTGQNLGVKVPNREALAGYTENDIIRQGKDIYLKPGVPVKWEQGGQATATQAITNVNQAAATSGMQMAGTDLLSYLGISNQSSEVDLLASVLESPEWKLYKEQLDIKGLSAEAEATAAKQVLDTKYEAGKTALENKLAEAGLAFSGIRGSQVKALVDSLAASKLDVDRKLASKVLDFDSDLLDKTLDLVTDKIKEATEGRKEALGFLEDMGLTINPMTGELTPTMEAQKFEYQQMKDMYAAGEKAMEVKTTFQTAGGKNWMITYDSQGNIVSKTDLGSAYKGTTGGGGGGKEEVGFTNTEKKKLEVVGLTDAPREEQLTYLYGSPTEEVQTVNFYVNRIIENSPEFVNDDATINWSAVPQNLRTSVQQAIIDRQIAKITVQEKVNAMWAKVGL